MTLREAIALLAEAGVPSPEYDAAELLAHVTGSSRTRLAVPSGEELTRFDDLVRRRAEREPLQHLTGEAHFRYVSLQVGPGVFVPRPETEVLAGWAIDRARECESPVVVDLCTGSGAIALSVATEVPTAKVYAVELGDPAVEWARRNLAGSGIELRHGDMADAFRELDGAVDVVVSNPPYIPLEAFESVAPEARDHDPALALWSGQDGLNAMRVVEATAARLLRPGGVVGAEHADVQGEVAPAVFAGAGRWADVRDHLDLAGRPRFVTARLAR
ncbi:MAG TPA: peptide chain release factor N(5)-glutamine methyltransferase [Nocardioidaceae bacterium]|nr:peptide chain release factor N(5)-glutamine methyltransferase [Nocardioidaceae bacterium]